MTFKQFALKTAALASSLALIFGYVAYSSGLFRSQKVHADSLPGFEPVRLSFDMPGPQFKPSNIRLQPLRFDYMYEILASTKQDTELDRANTFLPDLRIAEGIENAWVKRPRSRHSFRVPLQRIQYARRGYMDGSKSRGRVIESEDVESLYNELNAFWNSISQDATHSKPKVSAEAIEHSLDQSLKFKQEPGN